VRFWSRIAPTPDRESASTAPSIRFHGDQEKMFASARVTAPKHASNQGQHRIEHPQFLWCDLRNGSILKLGTAWPSRDATSAVHSPTPRPRSISRFTPLPTSRSGQYGRHIIEQNRFHDNTWATCSIGLDLGSIVRNNCTTKLSARVRNVSATSTLDKATAGNTLGQTRRLKWNIVGGRFS
jgi:hypothetical protein